MTYSQDALALRRPLVVELPRLGDRISFLHLDRVRVSQDRTGIIATSLDMRREEASSADTDRTFSAVRIPASSLSVLTLGPGTSISAPALGALHRAGTTVVVASDGGRVAVCTARPLTSRARYAEAQALLWSDRDARLAAARTMYRLRYPDLVFPDHAPLRVMRGVEGAQVKRLYRTLSKQAGLKGWKRETDPSKSADGVNPLLNLGNSILYGAAAAACTALALNPALGVIHKGAAGALLFDLADMHKARATIPLAFELHDHPDARRQMRTRLRAYLFRNRVLERDLEMLVEILHPFLTEDRGDRLIDDVSDVPGRINHGSEG